MILDTTVAGVRTPCREHFELTLAAAAFPDALPGQFVQILCRDSVQSLADGQAMLRRPFSVGGLRRGVRSVEIDILGRVVGPGTAWLAGRRRGDTVNILGPLGRPFSITINDEIPILVAGGVGLPPIRWLAETLCRAGIEPSFIYGAQSRDLLAVALCAEPARDGKMSECIKEFAGLGIRAAITTDDGSCGLRGRVTDALGIQLDACAGRAARVYACGPEPMLRAVAERCAARGVACEVAMERVMGCGMATCQSCVVPVRDGASTDGWRYALCCREGPVFDASAVIWSR
ncbi:MAG: dihydroorotate dehydrogenase B (NAD(+)), electron transfer subunit [Phycisphaerae bacterium]|nr:MAG: dihydroorotate dehydrogenase electron transfer subunit [Planctomycetota bacterium]GJQ25145.1 MAG: dihydroorotate dehydrogenase B (NAD(+)), electron transfer subunit [Phycisphaerae bacterium]